MKIFNLNELTQQDWNGFFEDARRILGNMEDYSIRVDSLSEQTVNLTNFNCDFVSYFIFDQFGFKHGTLISVAEPVLNKAFRRMMIRKFGFEYSEELKRSLLKQREAEVKKVENFYDEIIEDTFLR